MNKKGLLTFIGGFLLGSAGLNVLGSKVAQKGYRYVAAGAFIARDSIMEQAEKIQAAASDIAADANEIKEEYYRSCEEAAMQGEELGEDVCETVEAEVSEEN